MFEFGRDLRKLFAQARESEDLGWVELIGPDLLRAEALRESIDAGRVSCNRPCETEHRAAALWREHARRTGAAESLERVERCAASLARSAANEDQAALAAIDQAAVAMLRFDLCGGPDRLSRALALLAGVRQPRGRRIASGLAAIHARLKARTARLAGDVDCLAEAGGLMDAAIQSDAADDLDLRMDAAGLALETGVVRRDVRLLDQAGRSLGALVETASPDHRPLTRARALALCGAGLSALAAIAGHQAALSQARTLFDAAADQFTPDHSPLDWVAIQILRAGEEAQPLMLLAQAEALTQGGELVLGAVARERRITREIALAEAVGDLTALMTLETRLRARMVEAAPLDWSADQIGMAEILLARRRLTAAPVADLGLILGEAAATARERGVDVLADRAERLLAGAGA